MVGNTLNKLVISSNHRSNQIEIAGQIQSQACMMGIQELATKLNLQISLTKDLMEKAMITADPNKYG